MNRKKVKKIKMNFKKNNHQRYLYFYHILHWSRQLIQVTCDITPLFHQFIYLIHRPFPIFLHQRLLLHQLLYRILFNSTGHYFIYFSINRLKKISHPMLILLYFSLPQISYYVQYPRFSSILQLHANQTQSLNP